MLRCMRVEFQRLFRQRELWIALIACALVALAGLIESTRNLRFRVYETISSAERHTLLNTSMGTLAVVFFIPMLAALSNATSYVSERRNNAVSVLLPRCGARAYYWGKAAAIALTAFFLSCLPVLLNLAYCLIAYPLKPFETMSFGVIYEQLGWANELRYTLFDSLYLNHPVLDVLAHAGLVAWYGMNMALFTYGLSLRLRANVIVPLVLPMLAGVALVLPFSLLDWHAWYLYNYLQMMPGYAFPSLFPLFALLAGMTALACALIAPKAASGRDVLN